MSNVDNRVPIWKKYSLNISEAADYYGIGEKRLPAKTRMPILFWRLVHIPVLRGNYLKNIWILLIRFKADTNLKQEK